MQRLALAILLVAALIGLAGYLTAGLRKSIPSRVEEGGPALMQRVAYFVLIALILYVSIMGAGA